MTAAVVAGALAQAVAWWLVSRGRGNVWTTTVPAVVGAGALAVLVARPAVVGDVGVALAGSVGLVTGVVLYTATVAFVRVVRPRWRTFSRHATRIYGNRASLPLGLALVLSAGVVAVGEELFWRGLVQGWAGDRFASEVPGAVGAWASYVLANTPSANLAILAAAVVGGAVWTVLAAWSGGVLASVLCHACWTALMLARPLVRSEAAA